MEFKVIIPSLAFRNGYDGDVIVEKNVSLPLIKGQYVIAVYGELGELTKEPKMSPSYYTLYFVDNNQLKGPYKNDDIINFKDFSSKNIKCFAVRNEIFAFAIEDRITHSLSIENAHVVELKIDYRVEGHFDLDVKKIVDCWFNNAGTDDILAKNYNTFICSIENRIKNAIDQILINKLNCSINQDTLLSLCNKELLQNSIKEFIENNNDNNFFRVIDYAIAHNDLNLSDIHKEINKVIDRVQAKQDYEFEKQKKDDDVQREEMQKQEEHKREMEKKILEQKGQIACQVIDSLNKLSSNIAECGVSANNAEYIFDGFNKGINGTVKTMFESIDNTKLIESRNDDYTNEKK